MDAFSKRVHPLVQGFRVIKRHRSLDFREEWLKYGAIGYVACIEGYLRLWIARLVDTGSPYVDRIASLDALKFSAEAVVGIHLGRITIGDFVAHLLPLNGIADINSHFSTLLDRDFLDALKRTPASERNPTPLGVLQPRMVSDVDALFKLRHVYAHELATRTKVPTGKIERYIGSSASFASTVEDLLTTIAKPGKVGRSKRRT